MKRHLLTAAALCSMGAASAASGPAASPLAGPAASRAAQREAASYMPGSDDLTVPDPSELAPLLERYANDRAALLRLWSVPQGPQRRERMREFYKAWQKRLDAVAFDNLSVAGKVDRTLLRTQLLRELRTLDREQQLTEEARPYLPFLEKVQALPEARRRLESVDPRGAAQVLADGLVALEGAQRAVAGGGARPSQVIAARAIERMKELRIALASWYDHYDHFDPLFSWWVRDPYARFGKGLDDYTNALRVGVIGVVAGATDPIIGEPIGRAGLGEELEAEMIPYSPEELIDIANREMAWCEGEMKKAAREMGFGDDWKKALDKVRSESVPPGGQVDVARRLALEAIDYVEKKNLVSVPPLAADIWGWDMLSPERQKVAPFFLGGETLQIAYPADTMTQSEKIDSIRSNNEHFSRAVVHHELIPGHHLQGFMAARYSTQRRSFRTPFFVEGWALWFEFLLYDEGFPRSAEDRVGMLFWRMHRCARIIFSLSFHLGTMTPEQCVQLLVDRVGHERWTAEGEVRRSFGGEYSPLYQAAYMLGALQLRALHQELVTTGRMTNRAFHDRILREGPIPVEMLRALLKKEAPASDFRSKWRFAG